MKKTLLILLGLLISGVEAQVTYNGPAGGSVTSGVIVRTSDFDNLESTPHESFSIINHFEPDIPQMYIDPGNKEIKRKEF